MPSPRPNLTAAYVCATASAFCGAAVVILLIASWKEDDFLPKEDKDFRLSRDELP